LRFVEDEFGFKDIPFFTPILLYWFDGWVSVTHWGVQLSFQIEPPIYLVLLSCYSLAIFGAMVFMRIFHSLWLLTIFNSRNQAPIDYCLSLCTHRFNQCFDKLSSLHTLIFQLHFLWSSTVINGSHLSCLRLERALKILHRYEIYWSITNFL
jgi:hypothetical protein